MALTLTVCGCTGSYPGPDAACSGYLISSGDTHVLLDAGPGVLAAMQHHITIAELSAVVLTHAHTDHWTDLCGLNTALT